MSFSWEEFVKDRNEALLSLDEDKILDYMRKYDVSIHNGGVFWESVHKAILNIEATDEQRENSRRWLIEHGFDTVIK